MGDSDQKESLVADGWDEAIRVGTYRNTPYFSTTLKGWVRNRSRGQVGKLRVNGQALTVLFTYAAGFRQPDYSVDFKIPTYIFFI